jgi:peptidoglycan DL-endopeptidase CwlO
MFEKLLSLLLHAKGGAVATVLVLGASGALVTATVQNGLTTVTVTQPSASTTGSDTTTTSNTTTNNSVTQTVLALFNKKGEDDPTAPATGNGCSDAAHATNEQVQRVNDAFKTDHAAVLALSKTAPKTDAARTLVRTADGKIKDDRQAGVKAIHELFKSDECKGNGDKADEDKDTDDEDSSTTGTTGTTTGTTSTATTTTVAISCSDAKACADAAIAAMDKEVTDLTTALGLLTTAPATTNTTTDKSKSDNKSTKSTNKGKGHSEGKSHANEGDD